MTVAIELQRLARIGAFIKKEGRPVDEFTIKAKFELGASTYNQVKREAKLNPTYKHNFKITSERGHPDLWYFIVEEVENFSP